MKERTDERKTERNNETHAEKKTKLNNWINTLRKKKQKQNIKKDRTIEIYNYRNKERKK